MIIKFDLPFFGFWHDNSYIKDNYENIETIVHKVPSFSVVHYILLYFIVLLKCNKFIVIVLFMS